MKKYGLMLSAVLALGCAEAEMKPYVSVNAGLGIPNTSDVNEILDISIDNVDVDFDAGATIGLAVGLAMQEQPIRFELEYFFQKNEWDTQYEESGNHPAVGDYSLDIDANGDISTHALMANVYYDFTNDKSPFTVFLMGGVGVAHIEAEIDAITAAATTTTAGTVGGRADDFKSEDDTVLAAQLGGGLSYPISESVFVDAKYSYMITEELDFKDVKADFGTSRVTLGLRYMF